MLFDLRGRGRRRTVQVVYLSLAILLGGGLVLFGIGGDVQGGLFDAFSQNDGDVDERYEENRDNAKKRTETNPNNPAFWAELAAAELQLATASEGYNEQTGESTGDSREHMVAAQAAWNRHVKLAGDDIDGDRAAIMLRALRALGDDAGAVRAQEAVIDSLGDDAGWGDYANLAELAYGAGQDRKGDLAADKAVELAPKADRKDLRTQLDQLKTQTALQGAQTTTTPAG